MTITDLAAALRMANDDRLEGRMTRESHATVVRTVQAQLDRHGWTWDELAAEVAR